MEMNIFTDASITKTIYNETIGCAGAICLEDNNICKYEILRDATNNVSEITAIKLAVELAIAYKNLYPIINIWSDSQLSIYGLTTWIKPWMNNRENNIMKNSSGQDVKNQHVFLCIIKMIIDNNLNINFYHIKGHVNPKDIKSVNNAVLLFNNTHKRNISRSGIYDAIVMNNMVDNNTRELLRGYKNSKPISCIRGKVLPIISNEDLNIYYNSVTLGGNKI